MRYFYILLLAMCIDLPLRAQLIATDGSYTGEVEANVAGGIRRGMRYNGYATLGATASSDSLKLYRGGELRAAVGCTHGGEATAELIGDIQTASNIEAGNHLFIGELWYAQTFGRTTLIAGVQDLNTLFAACDEAADFINSSFGIYSTFSINLSSPIFPVTGLALTGVHRFNDKWKVEAGVFDGGVLDFDDNPYNMRWQLSRRKGYLSIAEVHYETDKLRFALGGNYHSADNDLGGFASIGVPLWQQGERQLKAFGQLSFTNHPHETSNRLYAGCGLTCTGVFSKKGNDWAGLSCAYAMLRNRPAETTLELSYKYHVGHYFFLQPDVQYILHPGGADEKLPNALVVFCRAGVAF